MMESINNILAIPGSLPKIIGIGPMIITVPLRFSPRLPA